MYWFQSFNLENIRFLVVDENEHMRLMLTGILRTLGCRYVRAVSNADAALEGMMKEVPDILITGLGLRPKSGICLVEEIRAGNSGAARTLPVIVVTSYTETSWVQSARDAGIDEFLAKPVSVKALYQRIANIINKRRPFVNAEEYFGPDRRRHKEEEPPARRRQSDHKKKAIDFD